MNGCKIGRVVTRIVLLSTAGALAACATAPPAKEMSIVDALNNQRSSVGPHSCAELDAAAICEKSTRLGSPRNCRCVDARALAEGRSIRF